MKTENRKVYLEEMALWAALGAMLCMSIFALFSTW